MKSSYATRFPIIKSLFTIPWNKLLLINEEIK